MENHQLDITIKHLPQIFPAANYDVRFIEFARLDKIEPDIETAETKDLWTQAEDLVYFKQPIQIKIFDRWEFEVIVNKRIDTYLYRAGSYVNITTEEGLDLVCFDFNIEDERNNNSGFVKYTISFSVKNQNSLSNILASDEVKLQEDDDVKINTVQVTVDKPFFIQYQPVTVESFISGGNPYTGSVFSFDLNDQNNIIEINDLIYVDVENSNWDPRYAVAKCYDKTTTELKFHFITEEFFVNFGTLTDSEIKLSYEPSGFVSEGFESLVIAKQLVYDIYTKLDPNIFYESEKAKIENKRSGISLITDIRSKRNAKVPIYVKSSEIWKLELLQSVAADKVVLNLSNGNTYYNVENSEFMGIETREDLINLSEVFLNFRHSNSVSNLYR